MSALTEAGNSVLTSSVFHRSAGNFCLCTGVLNVVGHSMLTQLAQQFGSCTYAENSDLKRRFLR